MTNMKQSVPAPPRELLDAMSTAAAQGNTVAEAMLNAQYRAWLRDVHGITDHHTWEEQ